MKTSKVFGWWGCPILITFFLLSGVSILTGVCHIDGINPEYTGVVGWLMIALSVFLVIGFIQLDRIHRIYAVMEVPMMSSGRVDRSEEHFTTCKRSFLFLKWDAIFTSEDGAERWLRKEVKRRRSAGEKCNGLCDKKVLCMGPNARGGAYDFGRYVLTVMKKD